jgi:hypothetical protein
MPNLVVNAVVALVTVATLSVCVLIVCQRPLTQRESHPPMLMNVSLANATAEPHSVSAAVTLQPESNTDRDALTTLCLKTTADSSQTNETKAILMQRNKIKEVTFQSCRVKRGEIILSDALAMKSES